MASSEPEQEIIPLPPRAKVTTVAHIRSTLLMSSQAILRETGLYDRYVTLVPGELREQIMQLGAPVWLPWSVGLAHYRACDKLGLSQQEVIAIAKRVAMHREGSFLGIALNLARGAGVTPWTMLKHLPKIWARAFIGGAVGGTKLGPKEGRLAIVGWPGADIPYLRDAVNGLALGAVKLVCRQAYVRTLPCEQPDSVAYQVSWA